MAFSTDEFVWVCRKVGLWKHDGHPHGTNKTQRLVLLVLLVSAGGFPIWVGCTVGGMSTRRLPYSGGRIDLVGNKSSFRAVVRFGKDRRHGFSSVHAPNGFRWDCRVAAINSRTRLRRASMRSTNWKSVSRSTHSGGTSPAIAHRVVSGKNSIRLNHGSNDSHPHTF